MLLFKVCLLLLLAATAMSKETKFRPNTNRGTTSTTTAAANPPSVPKAETQPQPKEVPAPEREIPKLCSAVGCPANACQMNLPTNHMMRICQAKESDVFNVKTIDCRYADLYPIGQQTATNGGSISNTCPGTDNLDCRCKQILTGGEVPAMTPFLTGVGDGSSSPPDEITTAADDCSRGGWNCQNVAASDGTTIEVSHRESTAISVAVVNPKTGNVLVPNVCFSMDCSIRMCVAVLNFGAESPNQTVTVHFGPAPVCGLGTSLSGSDTDGCSNQEPVEELGCDAARYVVPPDEGPNGWTRVDSSEDPTFRFANPLTTVEFCKTATLATILGDCTESALLPSSTVRFSIFADIRSPLPQNEYSLANASRLCPGCTSGPCCDVASHRTRQDVEIPVPRQSASTPAVLGPVTSLNMMSTVLDLVIDPDTSACMTIATIINAPAVINSDVFIRVGPTVGSTGAQVERPWAFDVTPLGACTEGGPGRTCQMWMLCSPITSYPQPLCVDLAVLFAANVDASVNHHVPIYAQEMVHLCLPASVVPSVINADSNNTLNGSTTNTSEMVTSSAPHGTVSIYIMPTVNMRIYLGLACYKEYDGVTPVDAGTPMCFEACVDNYPVVSPDWEIQLKYSSVDLRAYQINSSKLLDVPDIQASVHIASETVNPGVKRILIDRGFRDSRDQLFVAPPESGQYPMGSTERTAVDQDAQDRANYRHSVGQHCLRWTQFAYAGDGPFTFIQLGYQAIMTPRPTTPAAVTDTVDNSTAMRKLMSMPDPNRSHDRDHNRFIDPFFGTVSTGFVTACPEGTVGRRLPCNDGRQVDSFAVTCFNGEPVPIACDPAGWRGDDHSTAVAIILAVVGVCVLFCLFAWCAYYYKDPFFGTGSTNAGGIQQRVTVKQNNRREVYA